MNLSDLKMNHYYLDNQGRVIELVELFYSLNDPYFVFMDCETNEEYIYGQYGVRGLNLEEY